MLLVILPVTIVLVSRGKHAFAPAMALPLFPFAMVAIPIVHLAQSCMTSIWTLVELLQVKRQMPTHTYRPTRTAINLSLCKPDRTFRMLAYSHAIDSCSLHLLQARHASFHVCLPLPCWVSSFHSPSYCSVGPVSRPCPCLQHMTLHLCTQHCCLEQSRHCCTVQGCCIQSTGQIVEPSAQQAHATCINTHHGCRPEPGFPLAIIAGAIHVECLALALLHVLHPATWFVARSTLDNCSFDIYNMKRLVALFCAGEQVRYVGSTSGEKHGARMINLCSGRKTHRRRRKPRRSSTRIQQKR